VAAGASFFYTKFTLFVASVAAGAFFCKEKTVAFFCKRSTHVVFSVAAGTFSCEKMLFVCSQRGRKRFLSCRFYSFLIQLISNASLNKK
jgi:hypothetical protein